MCGGGNEIPLDEMSKKLTSAGIKIISQRKTIDGLWHIQLCNSSTGRVNAYEIASTDLPKALDFGFAYLVTPDTAKQVLSDDNVTPSLRPMAEGLPLPWPIPW